jgi:hypothetical protein
VKVVFSPSSSSESSMASSTGSLLSDDEKRARIWGPSPHVEGCGFEVAYGSEF